MKASKTFERVLAIIGRSDVKLAQVGNRLVGTVHDVKLGTSEHYLFGPEDQKELRIACGRDDWYWEQLVHAAIHRLEYVDQRVPCDENKVAIGALRHALEASLEREVRIQKENSQSS